MHSAAGGERMAGEEDSGVKPAGEVPGPQSCAGNLPWRSRLFHPGHFKQRGRQTAWGCRPDSEPPSFRRCSDLRGWQVSKKCPVGPSPSGRWCSGFALYPRGESRSACVRVLVCVHVCARVCLCVHTVSGSRLPRLLWLHSGTETPRERQRRERETARRQGRREGGERLSGRGRHWEIRELFSALSHQTPTATEGVAEPPARSTL